MEGSTEALDVIHSLQQVGNGLLVFREYRGVTVKLKPQSTIALVSPKSRGCEQLSRDRLEKENGR